jgi:hypothetical protein
MFSFFPRAVITLLLALVIYPVYFASELKEGKAGKDQTAAPHNLIFFQ